MDTHAWTAFAAASLVIAIIPGPGVASIVGFAFSSGRRVALASVAGMAVGNAVAMTVSLAGAGAILETSAAAFAAPFVRSDAPYLPQAAILIATFTGIAALTDPAYALSASRASGWMRNPAARLWSQRAGGGAVMGAGIAMAAFQR